MLTHVLACPSSLGQMLLAFPLFVLAGERKAMYMWYRSILGWQHTPIYLYLDPNFGTYGRCTRILPWMCAKPCSSFFSWSSTAKEFRNSCVRNILIPITGFIIKGSVYRTLIVWWGLGRLNFCSSASSRRDAVGSYRSSSNAATAAEARWDPTTPAAVFFSLSPPPPPPSYGHAPLPRAAGTLTIALPPSLLPSWLASLETLLSLPELGKKRGEARKITRSMAIQRPEKFVCRRLPKHLVVL